MTIVTYLLILIPWVGIWWCSRHTPGLLEHIDDASLIPWYGHWWHNLCRAFHCSLDIVPLLMHIELDDDLACTLRHSTSSTSYAAHWSHIVAHWRWHGTFLHDVCLRRMTLDLREHLLVMWRDFSWGDMFLGPFFAPFDKDLSFGHDITLWRPLYSHVSPFEDYFHVISLYFHIWGYTGDQIDDLPTLNRGFFIFSRI